MAELELFDFVRFNFDHLLVIDYLSLTLIIIAFIYFQFWIRNNKAGLSKMTLILANSVVLLSIVGLILQPEFRVIEKSSVKQLSLYTPSSKTNSDRLLEEISQYREERYVLSSALTSLTEQSVLDNYRNNIITSPSQLELRALKNMRAPNISGTINDRYDLKILGDGLTPKQIKTFERAKGNALIKVQYQSPKRLVTGLVKPHWHTSINLGDDVLFKAQVQIEQKEPNQVGYNDGARNSDGDKKDDEIVGNDPVYILRLLEPSGRVIEKKKVTDKEIIGFRFVPVIHGLLTYKIEVLRNTELLLQEVINVEVTKQSNLKLLILQSKPSFETKQLQKWAGDNQAKVVLNTQLNPKINTSRLTNVLDSEKQRYRSLNISKEILDDFDLLVIDSKRFQHLSEMQKDDLKQAVEDGLGIVVLVEPESLDHSLPLSIFSGEKIKAEQEGKVDQSILLLVIQDSLANEQSHLLSETPITHIANRFRFDKKPPSKSINELTLKGLILNAKGQSLVSQLSIGLGKVSYSLLKDTYRWSTHGEKDVHARFWQHLVKNTARNSSGATHLIDNGKRITMMDRQQLCFAEDLQEFNQWDVTVKSLSNNQASKVQVNKIPILNNRYCTDIQSETSGWHELVLKHSNELKSHHFYVNKYDAWLAEEQRIKINSTEQYRDRINSSTPIKGLKITPSYHAINTWIYWLALVISLSFIWVERKYAE